MNPYPPQDPLTVPPQKVEYGTMKSYLIGLFLSVLLTLAAYFLVMQQLLSGLVLDAAVALLGLVQGIAQLFWFLHMTKEPKPRWNLVMFLFMAMVFVIILFGSIWIMNNLNYNLMAE